VGQGGLLVMANSAHRIQLFGLVLDANEDWPDLNALSEHFGIVYQEGSVSSSSARVRPEHPLMARQSSLTLIRDNGVPFSMQTGQILAEVDGTPVAALVDYGPAGGQVLALADVGILGFAGPDRPPPRDNFYFLRNLARYARGR
jgi:hypothetical protein